MFDIGNPRYWVNYSDNSARVGYLKDCVALVDEKKGGEIAFFTNEDNAVELAGMLNHYEHIKNTLAFK
jgi:hypothetical protein